MVNSIDKEQAVYSNPCIKTGVNVLMEEYGHWFRCDMFIIGDVLIFNGYHTERMVPMHKTEPPQIDAVVMDTNNRTFRGSGTLVTHLDNVAIKDPDLRDDVMDIAG